MKQGNRYNQIYDILNDDLEHIINSIVSNLNEWINNSVENKYSFFMNIYNSEANIMNTSIFTMRRFYDNYKYDNVLAPDENDFPNNFVVRYCNYYLDDISFSPTAWGNYISYDRYSNKYEINEQGKIFIKNSISCYINEAASYNYKVNVYKKDIINEVDINKSISKIIDTLNIYLKTELGNFPSNKNTKHISMYITIKSDERKDDKVIRISSHESAKVNTKQYIKKNINYVEYSISKLTGKYLTAEELGGIYTKSGIVPIELGAEYFNYDDENHLANESKFRKLFINKLNEKILVQTGVVFEILIVAD
ncbi:MAG: hypothetical protein GX372_00140 [Ignavibacteria bacterium]|jgi:hypothetical protein|nr:hypothetical protein [Ignavibacteria bacterium]